MPERKRFFLLMSSLNKLNMFSLRKQVKAKHQTYIEIMRSTMTMKTTQERYGDGVDVIFAGAIVVLSQTSPNIFAKSAKLTLKVAFCDEFEKTFASAEEWRNNS